MLIRYCIALSHLCRLSPSSSSFCGFSDAARSGRLLASKDPSNITWLFSKSVSSPFCVKTLPCRDKLSSSSSLEFRSSADVALPFRSSKSMSVTERIHTAPSSPSGHQLSTSWRNLRKVRGTVEPTDLFRLCEATKLLLPLSSVSLSPHPSKHLQEVLLRHANQRSTESRTLLLRLHIKLALNLFLCMPTIMFWQASAIVFVIPHLLPHFAQRNVNHSKKVRKRCSRKLTWRIVKSFVFSLCSYGF